MNSIYKKNIFVIIMWLTLAILIESCVNGDDSISSLTDDGIPTTDDETTSSNSDSISEESSEEERQKFERDEPRTTTASLVLQPNVSGALEVGQGLLVPLVPVVDPNAKGNSSQVSPLVANLMPVTVENVTTENPTAETRQLGDMDVAEDIIFRPLFRYRQEVAQRRFNSRYYQPYVYAYKKRPDDYYSRQRRNYPAD